MSWTPECGRTAQTNRGSRLVETGKAEVRERKNVARQYALPVGNYLALVVIVTVLGVGVWGAYAYEATHGGGWESFWSKYWMAPIGIAVIVGVAVGVAVWSRVPLRRAQAASAVLAADGRIVILSSGSFALNQAMSRLDPWLGLPVMILVTFDPSGVGFWSVGTEPRKLAEIGWGMVAEVSSGRSSSPSPDLAKAIWLEVNSSERRVRVPIPVSTLDGRGGAASRAFVTSVRDSADAMRRASGGEQIG